MSARFGAVVLSVFTAATSVGANLPAPVQITPDGDGYSQLWSARNSPMSGGKILFFQIDDENNTTDDPVKLYDGSVISPVQPTVTNEDVNSTVFALGPAGSPGTVIGGWRRNNATGGYGNVSVNGAAPSTVTLNPEAVSIRDGCVFMVLQTGGTGNHAFEINPSTGASTKRSTLDYPMGGALRIHTSKCRAVWTFWNGDLENEKYSLGYWDGSQEHLFEFETDPSNASFVDGKMVYIKDVGGIDQVFLFDTDLPGDPAPVQVSAETDPNVVLHSAQTDGRHIVWYRSNADGSNAQLIVNGEPDFVFPTPALAKLHFTEHAFQLDRGQLLWKTASGAFQYDNGREQYDLDPTPGTNATVMFPWLTDGYIAFLSTTPDSGTDDEVFRVTASTPLAQPQPPLLAAPLPGSAQVQWDPIIGATSYNAYVAYEPGVTKDNYTTLTGGRKIENVTNGFTIPDIPPNTTYYVAISAVENGSEGPSSRAGSTTFLGPMQWHSVGNLSSTTFFSIAADRVNSSYAYAGAAGSVYRSMDGGINWTEILTSATTGSTRIRAIAAASPRVYVNTNRDDIWRSADSGGGWSRRHDGTGTGNLGSLLIEPSNLNNLYAGNFDPANSVTHSQVIRSANAGDSWTHTAQMVEGETVYEVQANALAASGATIFAGGNTTPNVAKTTDGGATWTALNLTGAGQVNSLSVDPTNANIIYAATRDKGVYKTTDGGTTWIAKNTGLAGVVDDFSGGAEFNSIIIDPENPNLLHLGAGNGYWYSIDGGENWNAANNGLNGAWIYAMAMTQSRRLLAATGSGIYMMSFAPAPVITSVSPASGNVAGGQRVTITGSGFQIRATVTFGGEPVDFMVLSAATISCDAPPHTAGTVDVVVTNPDFQSATATNAFTYDSLPNIPGSFSAMSSGAGSIAVNWNDANGATSYRVYRKSAGTGFVALPTVTDSFYNDSVTAGTAHVYKVRAVNSSGDSLDTNEDIATAIAFSALDGPVQAAHLNQIRSAINAVRHLAGLASATFSETIGRGVLIKALHLSELPSLLNAALDALGHPRYTEGGIARGQVIEGDDFEGLRGPIR